MLQKAKELFRLRSHKTEEKTNHLFKAREKALKKAETKKLNSNLVFNQSEYKSQKDNSAILEKRRSDLERIATAPLIDMK